MRDSKSPSTTTGKVQRLREENRRYADYIREKTNQLLQVMGTSPLRPEEFDDRELLSLDPIGIIAGSFDQVFENLNETIQQLSEARDELQAIFDATGVGISIIDRDFCIVKCNEKQRELLVDESLENVAGRYCYNVYCNRNEPGLDCPAIDTFETGRAVMVREVRKKDKFFQVITTPFSRNSAGEVTRVIEVSLDITEKKRAEEEEKRQRQFYHTEKLKLATVVESLSEGLVVTDTSGRILSANRAACAIFDTGDNRLISHPFISFFADQANNGAILPEEDAFNIEIPLRRNGLQKLLAMNSVLLTDTEGEPIGRVYTFRDITEEKQRQQAFHRAEKLAAVGQLSSGVAHELNTPLGSILGYARLLLKQKELSDQQREWLSVIAEQAKKSSVIIQGLLNFARISEPTGEPSASCDAGQVLHETLRILKAELTARNIDVETELPPDLHMAIDEKKLEQVLLNILLNSMQAMEKNGKLTITARKSGNRIQLSLSDTGPGIPAEILSRIFDPFFTTKEVGKGTGLGLSICSGIIKEHGGAIDVLSEPGEGATFTISLPLEGS
ncbi:MAG: hypothetical protein Kow0089_08020 [Desulfobulbaceae bacterium]